MKKYDIFISYSRKDFDEVNAIVEMLKNHIPTLNCWFDITGIESGDEFEDKIISAIDNSSYVLFALSDNSIQSQWAKDEVMYAKNTDTKVIPLILKGAQLKGWFLFKFGRIDCIDTTNSLQIEKLIKNLSDWTGKASVKTSNSRTSYSTSKASSSSTKEETKQDNFQDASSKIRKIYDKDGNLQYEGEMKDGKFHGQGTYYFTDGTKYVGEFKDNKIHGLGTEWYADGGKYVGQFVNGEYHGQGTLYYTNGSKKNVNYNNGELIEQCAKNHAISTNTDNNVNKQQVGKMLLNILDSIVKMKLQSTNKETIYFPNGDRYEGEMKIGKCHGQGTLYFINGDKYIGEFKNGKRHGQGTLYCFLGGRRIEGQFKDNHAQGIAFDADGGKYVGEFKGRWFNGKGTYFFANGRKYEGQFVEGIFHGQGTLYFTNGDKYKGEFKDNKRHGKGIYYYANGGRYEGQFMDNKFHGQGIFHHADGSKETVTYKNGERVKNSSKKSWKFW